MAMQKKTTTVRTTEKQRPVLYLVHQLPIKGGDVVTRKMPIWANSVENDTVMQAVLAKTSTADNNEFHPDGQTYWYEGVIERQPISADDLM